MKTVMVLISLLMLGGCARDGSTLWANTLNQTGHCPKPTSDQEFALNLAQSMADEGRLHASLANLESLPDNLDEVRLRKARVLRLLGSDEAEPLYRSLLGTCRAAQGEHGLGQLAAARGDNAQAQQHLLRASKLEPTDEKIRNDLGVVYLNQRKIEQARFQFLTAMELKQSDPLAALNLVTLLIYQDNWTQAAALASQAGLSPEQITYAKARADALKAPVDTPAPAKARVAAMLDRPAPSLSGVQP
ncbi:Tetratricopeptide repeat-containing protein [Pseudomonas asturiensis]|uniref:Tetratricopeptide repeat-containing protein n=1 Tax=Pseudomonas asturiensis TaxID=1190415 RepID=A0A1M7NVE2_9PSED|nr:tetratricopeptide repeat protein [Pseudomonas asturiensis]SHN08039.1 Tetratricopeptide repeat-containing protein [Pseudomonas asturiensis]